jgi:predicted ATP-dependent endonuclease of OLD family
VAEALVEAEGRFVILDEPALTLHPTWQRALRSRIQDTQGTFLVITHSANLVPTNSEDHLTRLIRVDNESGSTKLHRLRGLSGEDILRIVKEFSLSTDAVSLLFARGVVLLEGDTELCTLPKWFESCAAAGSSLRPADLDLAFYSVGGDTNFRTLVTVLHSLAIPWVLVCDGAAFDVQKRDKSLPHIFNQVLNAGLPISDLQNYLNKLDPDPSKRLMDTQVFDEEKMLGRAHGILTLAEGWKTADKSAGTPNEEGFEVFLESAAPGKLQEAKDAVGNSKVRMGLWIAENVPYPPEVNDLYKQITTVLRQRGLAS